MAAMLSGGQKFGLLSTTLNNTSSISNINEFGNSNFDGSLTDGLLGEGGTSRKPGSHSNSKSVVLVKLTDSALKAIAEYVKQRNHQLRNPQRATSCTSDNPTINFFQQSGTISIPSLPKPGACLEENQDGGESRTFNFNISDTLTDSGPQGSFECLQSSKCGPLDTMGSIQKKIQLLADGGTFKRFGQKLEKDLNESNKRKTQLLENKSGRTSIISKPKVSYSYTTTHNKPIAGRQTKRPSNDIHSSSFGNARLNDRASEADHPPPFRNYNTGCASPVGGGQLSANHPMLDKSSKGPYGSTNKQNPEIMKRTLRERIVHLLAVRPYKKPELMLRINRDGVKEKEKKNIMQTLGSVSEHKDNTYTLKRAFWNDVSEDWPFYTEEERQSFRRRKPQNLTPPGSDGGVSVSSIGSGHSSSSSHPGSPQPIVTTSVNSSRSPRISDSRGNEQSRDNYRRMNSSSANQSNLLKRASPSAGFGSTGSIGVGSGRSISGGDNGHQHLQNGIPPPKKKRVSNYRRPPDMQLNLSPNNSGTLSDYGGRSPAFGGSNTTVAGRSPRNCSNRSVQNGLTLPTRASPKSVLPPGVGLSTNDHISPSSESKASEWLLSNENNIGSMNRLVGHDSPQKSPMSSAGNLPVNNHHWNSMSPSPRGNMSDQDNMSYNFSQMPNHSPNDADPNATSGLEYVQQSPVNVCQNNEIAEYGTDTVADSEFMDSNDNANTMEHQECTYDNSPESHPGTIMPHDNRDYNKKLNSSPRQFVGSDFRKEYIKIRDRDTRKRYKVEFGRNYDRYRELHCKIEQVSKRFATLESELRNKPEGSESFKRMAAKVQKEYQATKGRKEFIAMRQEFEYLHEKMAHIKLLVQEYDKSRVVTN